MMRLLLKKQICMEGGCMQGKWIWFRIKLKYWLFWIMNPLKAWVWFRLKNKGK